MANAPMTISDRARDIDQAVRGLKRKSAGDGFELGEYDQDEVRAAVRAVAVATTEIRATAAGVPANDRSFPGNRIRWAAGWLKQLEGIVRSAGLSDPDTIELLGRAVSDIRTAEVIVIGPDYLHSGLPEIVWSEMALIRPAAVKLLRRLLADQLRRATDAIRRVEESEETPSLETMAVYIRLDEVASDPEARPTDIIRAAAELADLLPVE